MNKWVAFFSQTGSEINNIRKALGKDPDLIVTNRDGYDGLNANFFDACVNKIEFLPNRPTLQDYLDLINSYKNIFENCIITLNGYLRVIPVEICSMFTIYNLHPGLITKYPELKGFNPQEKAFKMHLATSGAVIHKVTPEVDSGEVIDFIEVPIENLTLNQVYEKLHDVSTELWVRFLKTL